MHTIVPRRAPDGSAAQRALGSSNPPDLWSATLLGAVAGGVDAVGWICLAGLLPSHLTASLVMVGARVGDHDASDVSARLAMIPVFVCAVIAVRALARWLGARKLPVLPILLSVLTLGLLAFCVAGTATDGLLHGAPRVLLWVGGIGVASMAVQNALMRMCLSTLCPTTVMTGNLTQLVISLVDLLGARRADATPASEIETRRRFVAAGAPLLGFLLGSMTCGFAASAHGMLCLVVPCSLALLTTLLAWRRWSKSRHAARSGSPGSRAEDHDARLLLPVAVS